MNNLQKLNLQLQDEVNPTPELKGYVEALNNVRNKLSENRELFNKSQIRHNVKSGEANSFELF